MGGGAELHEWSEEDWNVVVIFPMKDELIADTLEHAKTLPDGLESKITTLPGVVAIGGVNPVLAEPLLQQLTNKRPGMHSRRVHICGSIAGRDCMVPYGPFHTLGMSVCTRRSFSRTT